VNTRKEFEAACDRSLKLEALVLKFQDMNAQLQMAQKVDNPLGGLDVMEEDEADVQALVNDIHKYGRDAVIVREHKHD
jgi:hypothetical protein